MDAKSWNEDYAEEILYRRGAQIPELGSVKRMVGEPTSSDAKQQPPRKKPRNLGLLAWEKFHAAATPETEVVNVETNLSVIVGVEAVSVGGQDDCGKHFMYSFIKYVSKLI